MSWRCTEFVGSVRPLLINYLTMRNVIPIITAALWLGCGGGHDHDHHDHDHHNGADVHGHKAPHGGVLVNVENEFCHLEFVQEPGAKRLQMHAMRFHPKEGPVKFYAEKVEASARVGDQNKTLVFKPTELDGITTTQAPTSLYVAQIDWFEEGTSFEATLGEFSIEGKKLQNITFKFMEK